MIKKNYRSFDFMFRVPDAEVPEVEAILATSHEKWMIATHTQGASRTKSSGLHDHKGC